MIGRGRRRGRHAAGGAVSGAETVTTPRRQRFIPGQRLWRRGIGTAAAAALVSLALVAQGGVTTQASWNDEEWVNAPTIGAVDCEDPEGAFATRGEGRVLSGSALGLNTDLLAAVKGVEATNNGTHSASETGTPAPGITDAYVDPLDLDLLNTLPVGLSGVLQLNANTGAGVVNQFGQAENNGESFGASGYVGNDGGIQLHDDPADYPGLGSIKLKDLLNSVGLDLGTLVSGVADLSLEVGAVAGQASIDGCSNAWAASTADAITREYLATSADTTITSPTVGALVTEVNSIVTTLDSTVDGLVNDTVLKGAITGAVNGIVRPLLGLLGIGSTTIDTFEVAICLEPVTALTQSTITDHGGIVQINLAAGTITVNTAALLNSAGVASDGVTLNGLSPNTDLLSNPVILSTLTAALTSALSQWVSAVSDALVAALDGIAVKLKITVVIRAIAPVAKVIIDVDASLATLAAGGGVNARAEILDGIDLGILDSVISALTSSLGPLLAGILRGALPTVPALISTLSGLITPVVSVVSNLYNVVFLSGIVQIMVNPQNDEHGEPYDWGELSDVPIPNGQYDVAALRIGVLNIAQKNGVWLYLGRGSVGVNCSVAQAAIPSSPCHNSGPQPEATG